MEGERERRENEVREGMGGDREMREERDRERQEAGNYLKIHQICSKILIARPELLPCTEMVLSADIHIV